MCFLQYDILTPLSQVPIGIEQLAQIMLLKKGNLFLCLSTSPRRRVGSGTKIPCLLKRGPHAKTYRKIKRSYKSFDKTHDLWGVHTVPSCRPTSTTTYPSVPRHPSWRRYSCGQFMLFALQKKSKQTDHEQSKIKMVQGMAVKETWIFSCQATTGSTWWSRRLA
jgi:hypothetical protein